MTARTSAGKCGQICDDRLPKLRPSKAVFEMRVTDWHHTIFFGSRRMAIAARRELENTRSRDPFASKKMRLPQFVPERQTFVAERQKPPSERRVSNYLLNQTHRRSTKTRARKKCRSRATSHSKGQSKMKYAGSGLIGQTIKAGAIVAALALSTSAGYAQSSPFAGFDGAWSGTGTVSLSDGSNEHLHCRAVYQLDGTGTGVEANTSLRQRQLQVRSHPATSPATAIISPATGRKPTAISRAVCWERPAPARST